ncbi:Transcriptional regulator, LysR family [Caballeronia glathei]|uniref:LysR family transcriptional regulator n=1 Tax=Caballeronia glathei TaxID=60547 RepID=A0A069PCS2_9BURK|nr:LysR family transcriptional regulator [Caballeronia glathei]KDR38498.1 LysR family transcriptional regulator [Caballeronia glathei]CDY75005.1 Transcriptional regulator, LysR family [Caballeronia glathei]
MNEERTSKRLSIRHIRAFVAVAKHRSLTRAAESLFVTQSALSLTIQHLEDDLGVSLFDRSTRRLDLTQAGEEFLPSAERLLQDFDSSIREMRALGKRERGKVGVAAVPSVMALLLPEAVAAYIDAFPNIDIYLREDNSEAVQQRIVDGDVDFGICSPWEPDAELVFEPLFEDCFGVVFAPHHPLAAGDGELSWEEVSGYRIVGFSSDLGMQHQLSHTPGLSQEVREPRYRVSNTSTIETLLARGVGVSIMSALAAQRAPLDRLSMRLLSKPVLTRTVGIVRRQGKSLSPAAATLLQHIRATVPQLARFPGVRVLDAAAHEAALETASKAAPAPSRASR